MRARALGIALLAAALSGCWVLDELDEGQKTIDRYTAKKPGVEAEAEAAPVGRRAPRAADYFASQKNTRTFTPGSMSGEIVSCKLKSGTQFMKQSECVSRGGVPKG